MFRCVFRSGGNTLRSPWRSPPLAYGYGHTINRGIKLSAMIQVPNAQNNNRGTFSSEGWQHIQQLAAHEIGLYKEHKAARQLDWNTIKVRIARRHTIQRYDLDCFMSVGRAYTEAVCRRYIADNDKPLWWTARLVAGGTSPVVRNKGSARLKVAFRAALRGAGYDVEGRRKKVVREGGDDDVGRPQGQTSQGKAAKGGKGDEPWRKTIAQLYGTVEVSAHQLAILQSIRYSELQAYFERVVRGLEEELGKTADGHPAAPSQTQGGLDRGGRPRGGSEQRGGLDRQRQQGRPLELPQRSRPQNVRNAGGNPPTAATPGMRRLDLGRPANSDRR
ncbi:hypothetical protein VP1G_04933 [Cytospora mali]|uniref:Uncharacterized protein n=1 Tax=Cytospora mali TaxID=578113 RepID=A0A194V119_CYTMA|nr:hypothetical protein VP1G_04933 [Valsa mali var. pyri (nom. inval.)]